MNYQMQFKQLELDDVHEKEEKHVPAKRVDIVSVRMVKECSLMYKDRGVGSPRDGFNLIKQFLGRNPQKPKVPGNTGALGFLLFLVVV